MHNSNIENRVDRLEWQMADILQPIGKSPRASNWRRTIGSFADQPEMQSVFDAAEQERERDRQAFYAEFDDSPSSSPSN